MDRRRKRTDALADLLHGAPAFILAGGPSTKLLDLGLLNTTRGCWTIAINNAAAGTPCRPQAFICADPPSKFSHAIWHDPAIMKFVPVPKLCGVRSSLRRKLPDGTFVDDGHVQDRPNVWAFGRRDWLLPDDSFFAGEEAAWGNLDAGRQRTGLPKTVMTLLLAIRLVRYLGASKIYLIGVDWQMSPDAGYAWPQARGAVCAAENNDQYRIAGGWLTKMEGDGVFDRAGMCIYNCNPASALKCFPPIIYKDAIADAAEACGPFPPSLDGWYEK